MGNRFFKDDLFKLNNNFYDEFIDYENFEEDELKKFVLNEDVDVDIYNIYFRQISSYGLIDPDQEVKLFRDIY